MKMEQTLEFESVNSSDERYKIGKSTKEKQIQTLSYVSLFSGAGIGCYGFTLENYECVVTNEVVAKRLNVQRMNNKCKTEDGYVLGDLSQDSIKKKIINTVRKWLLDHGSDSIDVVVATPPCQGMSVANHKKKNEIIRNSLVIESINIVRNINPKFFIFENVRTFLKTPCVDNDGQQKPIKEAIDTNLSGKFNILYKVVNFKDYGVPSSRSRTLVLGVRKDLEDITPYDIIPDRAKEVTLREAIGGLPSLKDMGEISNDDIFHNFRPYDPRMLDWIKGLKEGGSAFENDGDRRPHRIIDGKMVFNTNKNADKYTRWYFDKVGPCIHTRNDILASQATIHPVDNRVYSIRELMIMMSIPDTFKWTDVPSQQLNAMSYAEKREFLKKNEMNIRQSIGEAVPTIVFQKIAKKIKDLISYPFLTDRQIERLISDLKLDLPSNLTDFIDRHTGKLKFQELSKIAELANSKRSAHAAYYTRQDICFTLVNDLPDFSVSRDIRILEPSVGSGNFLPLLFKKYEYAKSVEIDLVDIDDDVIKSLKVLINSLEIPPNFKINFINDDFLLYDFKNRYNVIIGNPPFKKIKGKKNLLFAYRNSMFNKDTNNLFSFFIEKSLKIGDTVVLITPKSLLSAPEFNKTREHILKGGWHLSKIVDFGENAFDVLIETIGITLSKINEKDDLIKIESYITQETRQVKEDYIVKNEFPTWLIYRNHFFDTVCQKLSLGIFKVFRDRQITKKIMKGSGKYRILRSRNLERDGSIVAIDGYDAYLDSLSGLAVSKYLNRKNAVIAPNLSYYPRAAFLPRNCIPDGSLAILIPNNPELAIRSSQLAYFSTLEFEMFYKIARNLGTRSLNIDSNSVYFWGLLRDDK
jgi:DNA (cytosine-5)-methyltransferase 1